MRVRPKRPWFGPRRFGWGWAAETWQGWAVNLIAVAAMAVVLAVMDDRHPAALIAATTLIVSALVVVCALTGTRPGGPTAWEKRHGVAHREGGQTRAREPSIVEIADRFSAGRAADQSAIPEEPSDADY